MVDNELILYAISYAEKAMKEDNLSAELQQDPIIRNEYIIAAYDRLKKVLDRDNGR